MPFYNARRHPGSARSVVLLLLVATFFVPAAFGATESVPRACDDMSFKVIAQMMDAASNFETRLVLLGKPLVQARSVQPPAGNEVGSTASDTEVVNVETLRNSLGEVWGYLVALENLAAVKDFMVEEHDRAAVDRQLKLVAQQIQEPLTFGLETAENVSAMTKHPAIAAEVSKIHAFMDQTRTQFSACAGRGDH
jgi:hypothetical protein